MMHEGSRFLRGVMIGVVAGAAIGFAVTPKSREAKRTASRFLRTCGDVVDTVGRVLHN